MITDNLNIKDIAGFRHINHDGFRLAPFLSGFLLPVPVIFSNMLKYGKREKFIFTLY